MEQKIKSIIDTIRPMLQADGGDVEFVSFNEGVVEVKLKGACGRCPHAMMTLKMGIERVLVEEIPEIREVRSV